jgi:hypothetical protein
VKELIYVGGRMIVSDELAEAVTDYAQALAIRALSDVMEIPSIGEDGTVGTSRLLLGPASQIVTEPVTVDPAGHPPLDDSDAIADLRKRTKATDGSHALAIPPDEAFGNDIEL